MVDCYEEIIVQVIVMKTGLYIYKFNLRKCSLNQLIYSSECKQLLLLLSSLSFLSLLLLLFLSS